ncbi:MAG: C40 family peptidase [Spirochaetaceae bacterium]|nr:C40 family peptidase [Spirochaetaceae bacterium]
MKALIAKGIFLASLFLFFSCDNFYFNFNYTGTSGSSGTKESNQILCPRYIKEKVVDFAYQYADADTFYEWGGQDPLRAIGIDCSGLVVRCYSYATSGTGYSLIQSDMSSAYMYESATSQTTTPEAGDLVFMGEVNSSAITHVGIFVKKLGTEIYFIDSTDSGSTNGVSERSYDISNKKIKGYGIMKLKQK